MIAQEGSERLFQSQKSTSSSAQTISNKAIKKKLDFEEDFPKCIQNDVSNLDQRNERDSQRKEKVTYKKMLNNQSTSAQTEETVFIDYSNYEVYQQKDLWEKLLYGEPEPYQYDQDQQKSQDRSQIDNSNIMVPQANSQNSLNHQNLQEMNSGCRNSRNKQKIKRNKNNQANNQVVTGETVHNQIIEMLTQIAMNHEQLNQNGEQIQIAKSNVKFDLPRNRTKNLSNRVGKMIEGWFLDLGNRQKIEKYFQQRNLGDLQEFLLFVETSLKRELKTIVQNGQEREVYKQVHVSLAKLKNALTQQKVHEGQPQSTYGETMRTFGFRIQRKNNLCHIFYSGITNRFAHFKERNRFKQLFYNPYNFYSVANAQDALQEKE